MNNFGKISNLFKLHDPRDPLVQLAVNIVRVFGSGQGWFFFSGWGEIYTLMPALLTSSFVLICTATYAYSYITFQCNHEEIFQLRHMLTCEHLICTFRHNCFVHCLFSSPTSAYAFPNSIWKLLVPYSCAVIF